MAHFCTMCGNKLGLVERVSGKCKECEAAAESQRESARAQYQQLVTRLAVGELDPHAAEAELKQMTTVAEFKPRDLASVNRAAIDQFADRVLADDILTEQEETSLLGTFEALGVTQEALTTEFKPLLFRLSVARVNDGRLPEVPTPQLVPKKGEIVHIEMNASLMKEVTLREYRAGYSGVSFRIAKGVRFHTGGVRGHSVVVGTEMQVEDTGVLSVSSKRAAFLGLRKTMEMPFSKLLSLNVFTDGIQFHMSNRQRAPMFKLDSGEVVAAVVNAAAQKLEA